MELKKVLVIDDEQDLCFLIKTILEETGQYKVLVAFSCIDGMMLCLRELPDIVFLDYVMPEERGDSIINFLKVNGRTKRIPIVLMSGLGEVICFEKAELKEWFLNSPTANRERKEGSSAWQEMPSNIVQNFGVEFYLPKPFSKADLLVVTQKVLSERNKKESPSGEKSPTDDMRTWGGNG